MKPESSSRREFLHCAAFATAFTAGSLSASAAPSKPASRLHLATNVYPWFTFYNRDQQDFYANLDASLQAIASCGLNGYEPIIERPEQIDTMAPLLKKHHLEMQSFYVNSTLHEAAAVEQSIRHIAAIADKARAIGTRIIVTNPSPIRWGGPEDKNDAQLRVQAAALNRLGRELSARKITLAYHNHDPELRQAAREFHHMMVATDPKLVTLCLDAHWIYRGSGNSAVALFDVLELHGPRITELHLRQSVKGVWTEAFGDGDIDYPALVAHLKKLRIKPHVVLEQAVEAGTPKTLDAVAAHRRSVEYARQLFGA